MSNFFTQCGEHACGFTDYFPVLTGTAAIALAIFGVWKYFHEVSRDRAQLQLEREAKKADEDRYRAQIEIAEADRVDQEDRERKRLEEERQRHQDLEDRERERARQELLWKHHQEARSFLLELRSSKLVSDALKMIDYHSAQFAIPSLLGEFNELEINRHDVVHGLRTDSMTFSDKDEYIRKCFDEFLVYVGEISYFLEQGNVPVDYFVPFLGWYSSRAKDQEHIESYCQVFGLNRSWVTLIKISNAFSDSNKTSAKQ